MNLLDTGVVIDNIDEGNYSPAIISIITMLEVLRGLEDKKRSPTRQLLKESYAILNLDDDIVEVYCHIYRVLKENCILLPDADLLISATAIAHNLTLETRDEHFQRLKTFGLRVI
jgi:predicted nucleic acid-binding protein